MMGVATHSNPTNARPQDGAETNAGSMPPGRESS
jgi:hypothetical protein